MWKRWRWWRWRRWLPITAIYKFWQPRHLHLGRILPSCVKITSFVQKLWQISSSAKKMPWNDTFNSLFELTKKSKRKRERKKCFSSKEYAIQAHGTSSVVIFSSFPLSVHLFRELKLGYNLNKSILFSCWYLKVIYMQ